MAGYGMLMGTKVKKVLSFNHSTDALQYSSEDFLCPIDYQIENNCIVFLSPMYSTDLPMLLNHLSPAQLPGKITFLDHLIEKGYNNEKPIFLTLIGPGATEEHLVTAYIPANTEENVQIFDPKASDPYRFLTGMRDNKFFAALKGLWGSLVPKPETKNIPLDNCERRVDYMALGTQSFFDGISCGYHSAINIKLCKQLIKDNQEVNLENLLSVQANPVQVVSNILQFDNRFFSFIKEAWKQTYKPFYDETKHADLNSFEYFMGLPLEETWQKVTYVLAFGWIVNPLINLIKIPFDFIPNAISKVPAWMRDRLIDFTPTHFLTQYMRSALMLLTYPLQGMLSGLHFILKSLVLPVTCMQVIWHGLDKSVSDNSVVDVMDNGFVVVPDNIVSDNNVDEVRGDDFVVIPKEEPVWIEPGYNKIFVALNKYEPRNPTYKIEALPEANLLLEDESDVSEEEIFEENHRIVLNKS